MCGIVGYIGKQKAVPVLLDSLEKLEYRGYDSAGIAVYNNEKIEVIKDIKKVAELRKDIAKKNINSKIGIGHTRWATHGKPTIENAHPHSSCDGKFAIVHNGIIENYIPIKEKLISNGLTFYSDTDTEVIVNLLCFYKKEFPDASFFDVVKKVLSEIEGSYALAIMYQDEPDKLIVAKKNSPLIIGIAEGETFIASDVVAIVSNTKEIVRLDDGELAIIKPGCIEYFNDNFEKIHKCSEFIDWTISTAEKGGYAHFMLKEIMEQPKAARATICPRIIDEQICIPHLDFSKDYIENIGKIWIIGCGSAYHVGRVA
ncbi:MAG: isomerizing glutamine--fructose-6-phosphate transaminase, partial [Clostridia bacterium]|nr:isomerizing glutamine--fructose-6-phosphate transaminase [Clostridia bacterium]